MKTFEWIDKMVGVKVFDWIYDEDEKKECYKRTDTDNLVKEASSDWICEIPVVLEVLAERVLETAIELAKVQLDRDYGGDVFQAEIVAFVSKYDEIYANEFLTTHPDVQAVCE